MIYLFFLLLLRSGNRNSLTNLLFVITWIAATKATRMLERWRWAVSSKKAKLYSERHAVKTHRRCKKMCAFKRMMIMINATSRIRMIIMMMLSSNNRNNKNPSRNNNKNYQNNNSDTICNNNMKQ